MTLSLAPPASGDCIVSKERVRWKGCEYMFDSLLGTGRFASVWLAHAQTDSQPSPPPPPPPPPSLAVKVTSLSGLSAWARAQLVKEIGIWTSLNHPHIVHMYGAISNETSHCVLLEHAAGRVNAPTFESLKRPPPIAPDCSLRRVAPFLPCGRRRALQPHRRNAR